MKTCLQSIENQSIVEDRGDIAFGLNRKVAAQAETRAFIQDTPPRQPQITHHAKYPKKAITPGTGASRIQSPV
jgi:hypothetical protein